jgi:hypothetical protein
VLEVFLAAEEIVPTDVVVSSAEVVAESGLLVTVEGDDPTVMILAQSN